MEFANLKYVTLKQMQPQLLIVQITFPPVDILVCQFVSLRMKIVIMKSLGYLNRLNWLLVNY